MSCSFSPPSNGRFRPPLSLKAFPVHRVEIKNASREVGFFFFSQIYFFPFWLGVVLQFFGNTVICLRKWEKSVPFQKLSGKKNL